MDIGKVVEFVSIHVSEYLWFAGLTLARPGLRFAPATSATGNLIDAEGNSVRQAQLHPKLLTFVAASLIGGSVIADSWPGRPEDAADISLIVLIGGIWWIVGGVLVHGFCRVLRGSGTLLDTLSITLQLSAVVFLTCSLLAFIIAVVGEVQAESAYYVLSGSLFIVYTPLALRRVHRFGVFRAFALAIYVIVVGAVYTGVSAVLYERTGIFVPPSRGAPRPLFPWFG